MLLSHVLSSIVLAAAPALAAVSYTPPDDETGLTRDEEAQVAGRARSDALLACADEELWETRKDETVDPWVGVWMSVGGSTNTACLYLLPRTGATLWLRGCFHSDVKPGEVQTIHADGVTVAYAADRLTPGSFTGRERSQEYYLGRFDGRDALFSGEAAIALAASVNLGGSTIVNNSREEDLLCKWSEAASVRSRDRDMRVPEAFQNLLVSEPVSFRIDRSLDSLPPNRPAGTTSAPVGSRVIIRVLEGHVTKGQSIAFGGSETYGILYVDSNPDASNMAEARVDLIEFNAIEAFDLSRGVAVELPARRARKDGEPSK
ncbi:MAG: hypothetical protein K2Y21_01245 [Phycisphaerales bacterium]|nr:hypothetical protein [Phycisphaerales bacterium]